MIDRAFWKGRKVFITGHTGFKGSWLTLWLQTLGAEITGYALPPSSEPNLYTLARIGEGVRSIIGDIRDRDALRDAMRSAQPEIVLHLAAQSLVRLSYSQPVETYATNVMGTAHVLDEVRAAAKGMAVVVVTSDKCYENREWPWGYREIDPMGGYDPYSSSKGCAELVTASYRSAFFHPDRLAQHGVALASARAGNVIGGGDWAADRLIPDIVRALSAGERPLIRNPLAVRPWQHVLEPLSGYLLLAQNLATGGKPYCDGWNFGPEDADAKPVGWIADRAVEAWGGQSAWNAGTGDEAHEAHLLRLDSSKARQQLRWRPRWAVQHALERTLRWHRQVAGGADARELTLADIHAYETAAAA